MIKWSTKPTKAPTILGLRKRWLSTPRGYCVEHYPELAGSANRYYPLMFEEYTTAAGLKDVRTVKIAENPRHTLKAAKKYCEDHARKAAAPPAKKTRKKETA